MTSAHLLVCRVKKKALALSEKGPRPGGTGDDAPSLRETASNHAVTEQSWQFLAHERHRDLTNVHYDFRKPEELGYSWNRFTRQRHQRMELNAQFDESTKKFEKFGGFSFSHEDPFGHHCSPEEFIAGSHWMPSDTAQVQFNHEDDEEQEEASQSAKFFGLRKARFFQGCSRADRAFDSPRLPYPTPPHSAREATRPEVLEGADSNRAQSSSPPATQRDAKGATAHDLPGVPQVSASRKVSGLSMLSPPMSAPGRPRRLGSPNWMRKPGTAPSAGVGGALPTVTGAQGSSNSLGEEPASISESMSGFVASCKQARMNPVTTGIIRPSSNQLKLEYGCMTDARAEAILHTLRASSSDVKEASFQSNGLTEKGAKYLLGALPEDVEVINLSENTLGHTDAWCVCFKRLLNLRTLSISSSELGDNICRTLCECLKICRQLRRLNLSGNHIHKAAAAIGSLIQSSTALEELDVHWNNIAGDGARDLVRGLLENGSSNFGCLSNVNLSYNPIGKGSTDDACKLLAEVFRESKVLTHLNLSKCDLSARQCELLADGLKDNATLLGIHLGGNAAMVNAQGFIVPQKHGAALQVDGSAVHQAGEEDRTGAEDLCWVCNRWSEVRIAYDPGISGPDVSDAWVYTSADNFERAIKLTKSDESLITYFMCPPGILRFVFQAGTEIVASRTASVMYNVNPKIKLRRVLTPRESEDDDHGKPVSLDMEIDYVNTRIVPPREPDAPVCECSVPRKVGKVQFDRYDTTWKVESSLFGPYEEALEKRSFCERCFELDWKNSCVADLIDDDADRIQVRDALRAHYAEIKVLYGSLCSVEQNQVRDHNVAATKQDRLTFGVTMNEYTHMLVQHHILNAGSGEKGSDELSLYDADAQFLLAAAPSSNYRTWGAHAHTDGRIVQRHGFFELLVRLALTRFRREELLGSEDGAKPKSKAKSASHALDILLNKHIMYPHPPMKYNFNCVQWRVDVLHTEEVEHVLKKHVKATIDPLFNAFSHQLPDRMGRHLQVEDWFHLLDRLHLLPVSGKHSLRNTWDRSWIWQTSAMSHVDELSECDHLMLSWPEFLEALARLVGLLTARKHTPTNEEMEKTDYGLGYCSPSYAFCMETSHIGDKYKFAQFLDTFLSQPSLKQLLEEKAAKKT